MALFWFYSASLKFCRVGTSFDVFILPVDEPSWRVGKSIDELIFGFAALIAEEEKRRLGFTFSKYSWHTHFRYPSSKLVTPDHFCKGKVSSFLLYILVVRNTSVIL